MYFFSDAAATVLYRRVRDIAISLLGSESPDKIYVSGRGFAQALRDADVDIHFMTLRRGLDEGVSEGKLAGALYFRLTRTKVITVFPTLSEQKDFQYFQERVMMLLVGELIHIDFDHPWIRSLASTQRGRGLKSNFQDLKNELIFLTWKRHYNQESLALFFDSCVYLMHAVDTLDSLKGSIDSLNAALQATKGS